MYAPERDEHVKSAAAALGPAASYLCTPEAHGNAPSSPAEVVGQYDGGTAGRGLGPGEAFERRREEKEAEKARERGRGKEKLWREKRKLGEKYQQLPSFGYSATSRPLQHTTKRS